jgi:hypothetical protein
MLKIDFNPSCQILFFSKSQQVELKYSKELKHAQNPQELWSLIQQMLPGSFAAPKLSAEPGTTGRVLRVTVGLMCLCFTTYYNTTQLRSLLVATQTILPAFINDRTCLNYY